MNKLISIRVCLAIAVVSMSGAQADPAARLKSAEIVDVPAKYADWQYKIGNLQVRFTDGHVEVLTKDAHCLQPIISPTGALGWIHFSHMGGRDGDALLDEELRIRLPDGKFTGFEPEPNGDTLFIEKWGFTDGGASVVMKTRSWHGPAAIHKIDIKTGKITGRASTAGDDLPKWAKAYSDD